MGSNRTNSRQYVRRFKMEEKDLQKEVVETKVPEVKEEKIMEKPIGYYLAEKPTSFERVIALGDEEVSIDELIIKMANAMKDAGILK